MADPDDRLTIRTAKAVDEPILWTMLMHAAHEESLVPVRSNPDLVRYVKGWGRVGDVGVVAQAGPLVTGAAWLRLWSGDDRGYGYVADDIPELAIAVLPDYHSRGIGTAMLREVIAIARGRFPAISLNVRANSPAARLYERMGFVRLAGSEMINRTGGGSFNMVQRF